MKNLEVPPREKLRYVAVKKTFNCRQETKQSNSCRHCCGARSRTLSARLCICILLFLGVSDYIFSLFQGSLAYSLYGFLCKSKDLSSVLPFLVVEEGFTDIARIHAQLLCEWPILSLTCSRTLPRAKRSLYLLLPEKETLKAKKYVLNCLYKLIEDVAFFNYGQNFISQYR